MKLISIEPSTRKDKKYVATFDDGTTTHFGTYGYDDYTMHKDEDRKARYIQRHRARENWDNPRLAGTLSRYILWNLPSLKASVVDYKRRFNL